MNTYRQKIKAFTLIELLVVIAIIAILAALGLVAYSSAQRSARDAMRMGVVRDIAAAMEQHKVETNPSQYPSVPTHNDIIGNHPIPEDPNGQSALITGTGSNTTVWCVYYPLEQTTKGNCSTCSCNATGCSFTGDAGAACAMNKL